MGSAPPPGASTAKSYALVGLIFYVLVAAGALIAVTVILVGTVVAPGFPGFFIFIPIVFLALPVGFAVWAWVTYQQIELGEYEQARAPALVLGVLGIFLALVIGGIFFLLAYGKLGEVLLPAPAARGAAQFCVGCGRAVEPGAKFCSHCGKEVPE